MDKEVLLTAQVSGQCQTRPQPSVTSLALHDGISEVFIWSLVEVHELLFVFIPWGNEVSACRPHWYSTRWFRKFFHLSPQVPRAIGMCPTPRLHSTSVGTVSFLLSYSVIGFLAHPFLTSFCCFSSYPSKVSCISNSSFPPAVPFHTSVSSPSCLTLSLVTVRTPAPFPDCNKASPFLWFRGEALRVHHAWMPVEVLAIG